MALVGTGLPVQNLESQRAEAAVKCRILNRKAALGLTVSERVHASMYRFAGGNSLDSDQRASQRTNSTAPHEFVDRTGSTR